ncbi:MAG: DUF4430 domain-containing protein [Lachnospiraceae bacterium]|nr:DUF4430 domain-containing protein [Lachnospiraceae bacterium]
MSKKTKAIIVAAFAVVVIAIIAVFALTKGKSANQGGKSFTIEIVSDRDSYNETVECNSELEYLGQYLRTMDNCQFSESEYGIYVQGFNNMMEDMDNQYWWCINVNGEMASTGADEIPLTDGDTYSFVLKQGW